MTVGTIITLSIISGLGIGLMVIYIIEKVDDGTW
jgi:hypothetical protein